MDSSTILYVLGLLWYSGSRNNHWRAGPGGSVARSLFVGSRGGWKFVEGRAAALFPKTPPPAFWDGRAAALPAHLPAGNLKGLHPTNPPFHGEVPGACLTLIPPLDDGYETQIF